MTRVTLIVHQGEGDPVEADIVVNEPADAVTIEVLPDAVKMHTPHKPTVITMPKEG